MGLDADFDDNLVFIFSLAFLYLSTKVSRKSRIGLQSETHTYTRAGVLQRTGLRRRSKSVRCCWLRRSGAIFFFFLFLFRRGLDVT